MAWVVDTCVLIDILDDDPEFGGLAADKLDEHRLDGLMVCPVTQIELSPAFCGDWRRMEEFFHLLKVSQPEWTVDDTKKSFLAWSNAVELKRSKRAAKRPVADIMIGAFSIRFQGLITRNGGDFKTYFPKLNIIDVA